MKHFGDITKIDGSKVPIVDIITGGSPCQDLSIAGKRAGLQGERSGLFMEQIRIIKEMHDECRRTNQPIRPRYMVWENVVGALSSGEPSGEDFRIVLEETARIVDSNAVIPRLPNGQSWSNSGAVVGDNWSISWRVHDAQFWGVAQRRRRISLVADFRGQTAPEIQFERESLFGSSQQIEEERQRAATDSGRSLDTTISFQERAGCDGGGKGILIQRNRTGALSTVNNQVVLHTRGGQTSLNCNGSGISEDVAFTLNRIDNHAVCFSQDAYDKYTTSDKSPSLKNSGGNFGGGQRNADKVGSLQARDYKGVGNQYVADGKCIIEVSDE